MGTTIQIQRRKGGGRGGEAKDLSSHSCVKRMGFWEKQCRGGKKHRILYSIAKLVTLHVYSVYIVICFAVSVVHSILKK